MAQLTPYQRSVMTEQIVQQWLDAIDMETLMNFYADTQTEYLEKMNEEEFLATALDSGVEPEEE